MSIEVSYNSWATIYDSNENKTRDLDKEVSIQTLSKYSFERVLELGCGTGKNTEWLVQQNCSIIAFDFSEKMLAVAQKKLNSPKITFIRADLNQNWKVPDNSFDLITGNLVLEHIFDLEAIFKKSYQKLKQKGLFFICELHPFKQYLGTKARFLV